MLPPIKEQYTLQELIDVFELTNQHVQTLTQRYPDPPTAQKALDGFKVELKSLYRKAAMKHHPDKGGDPEAMKVVNKMYQIMMKSLRILVPRPRPTVVVHFHATSGTYAGPDTTNSNYWYYTS